MKRWGRTQTMLMLLMAAVFLGAFLTISTFTNRLLTTKQSTILMLERDRITEELELQFSTHAEALRTVADLVRNQPENDALIYAMMADMNQRNESVYTVYFGRPDNTMINVSGFVPPPDFDLTQRPWYIAALESDCVVTTHAFLNATEDRMIVTLTYAVYDGETLLGVMAADIDLFTMQTLIAEKTVGDAGYAFLIDRQEHLIAHPNIDLNALSLIPASSMIDVSNMPFSDVKMMSIFEGEGEGAVTTQSVFCGQFTLGVVMPASEFYATRQLIFMMSMAALLIVTTLGIGLALFQHHRVLKPVQALLTDIGHINLATRLQYRLPIKPEEQFKELRVALNAVLETTENHYLHKMQAERSLLLEGQRLKLMMDASEDILFQINRRKQYTRLSGKKLAIFGHPPEYYIGKSILEVFGDVALDRDCIYDQVLNGETKTYDWHTTVSGQTVYFSTILSPIRNEDGHIVGAAGVARDVTIEKERHQEVERLSYQDFLTGVYNRRYFSQTLSDYNTESKMPLGVFMIDVNGLKIFNDVYGHETGDLLLKKIAKTLKNHLPRHHVLARIGGDEFAAVIPNTDAKSMQALQENMFDQINQTQLKGIPLSVSIGYDIKAHSDTAIGAILKTAENRMYRHKLLEGKKARHQMINIMFEQLLEAFPHEREHAKAVSRFAVAMGQALDFNNDRLKTLETAALYHDIGKIALRRELLDKTGRLTKEDRERLKQHTETGYLLLRAADAYAAYAETALFHHEHYDGSGYPQGIKGKDIPLFSRIVCIAEAYDAMTRKTPYRPKPMSPDVALAELHKQSGKQFDPDLIEVFSKQVTI